MPNHEMRQHYVPQGYLRRFKSSNSNNKVSRIWVYDKKLDKKFNVPIQTIASRDSFYDSFIDDHIEKYQERGVENLLREEEDKFYLALSALDECVRSRVPIDEDTKITLSFYLYLQFVRTYKFRETLKPSSGEKLPNRVTPENYGQIAQIFGMTYSKLIEEFMRACLSKTWIIYEMQGALRVFTSDNPVVFSFDITKNTLDQVLASNRTFSIEGMKIIFPLDPKHVLFLYERGLKPDLDALDGMVVEFNTEESASLYMGLSNNSDRQVYSSEDTQLFELVKILAGFHEEMEPLLAPIEEMFVEARSLNSSRSDKGKNNYSLYLNKGINNYSSYIRLQQANFKLRQAKQAYELLIKAFKRQNE